jgi:D-cysteine desulfhydrase
VNLDRFPRRRYSQGLTPLEPLPRLSAHLGGPEIWVKRDDLLGLAGGGNKTRKLEFLVADALVLGADTLVTTGAPQSNHCRLTLAAAAREGLACRLVIEERVPGSFRADAVGNHLLFDIMGVEALRVVPAGTDLAAAMEAEARLLRESGRRPYVIAGGGSVPLGAIGYADCAREILAQATALGLRFDALLVASGSAGTHAGLVAGLTALGAGFPAVGINVRRPRAEQEANVHRLAAATAQLMETEVPPVAAIEALDQWVGPGYSLPTRDMVEAVRLVARLEGLLLDPVYSGKAMAGLVGLVRAGRFGKGQRILFVHTGGAPSLHAFAQDLRDEALQPGA